MKSYRPFIFATYLISMMLACGGPEPRTRKQSALDTTWLIGNASTVMRNFNVPIKQHTFSIQVPPLPSSPSYLSSFSGSFAITSLGGSNYLNFQYWRSGTQYVGTLSWIADNGTGGTWHGDYSIYTTAQPGQWLYWEWNANTAGVNTKIQSKNYLNNTVLTTVSMNLHFLNGTPPAKAYSPMTQFGALSAVDCTHDFPYATDGGSDCYFPVVAKVGVGNVADVYVPFSSPTTQDVCSLKVSNTSTSSNMEWEI